MGFSRQDYWSGLPCPPPILDPGPGMEPVSPMSPELQVDSLPAEPLVTWGSPMLPLVLCIWLILSSTLLSFKNFLSCTRHSLRHPTEHKGREDSGLNCLCSITHPHEQRVYQEILPGGLTWPLESLHSTNTRQKVS